MLPSLWESSRNAATLHPNQLPGNISLPKLENMISTPPLHLSETPTSRGPRRSAALLILTGLWVIIFFAALFAPPILDDADATHANAARHMAITGDLVTLQVNGIRYLEKAPLPYWLVALCFRIFGFNTFATHLPEALAILLLTLLGYRWARQAFGLRAAFYTGLALLTSAGVFLFTRVFIPEALLSLFLCTALYCFLKSLAEAAPPPVDVPYSSRTAEAKWALRHTLNRPAFKRKHLLRAGRAASSAPFTAATEDDAEERFARAISSLAQFLYPYLMWVSLALAVLTKGLVALVFFVGSALIYLVLTGEGSKLGRLKLLPGPILFLAIAAPWHILAGIRNTGGMNGHGFFWFYFINEHVLRFLGRRYPRDYNKLPGYLYWTLHMVWLFPWSLFLPLPLVMAYRWWKSRSGATFTSRFAQSGFQDRTTLLLSIYAALILLFFSVSTNQEYYTFPAYLPMLMLIAVGLVRAEDTFATTLTSRRWITLAHAALTLLGFTISATLAYGLWTSRHLAFVPDIGDLLAHRGVGDYTLAMSHLFDLTGPSFAALRLPAMLAALAFAFGPLIAWLLRQQRHHLASTSAIALTSSIFLIAAHIALVRFGPMLSSANLAVKIEQLKQDSLIDPDSQLILYGDQTYGSSIAFYLGEQPLLVNGRTTSMIFGSTFPDAPPVFLTNSDLLKIWGNGKRKLLFVPLEQASQAERLLGSHKVPLMESSGKTLYTDRPLDPPQEQPQDRASR